jgi:hypothetical protein
MRTVLKLLIPLGLGVLAAFLNLTAATTAKQPVYFVCAKSDIPAGTLFTEQNLKVLPVPADAVGSLKEAAVPYSERAILYDRECPRSLKAGDVIFYRDATPAEPQLVIRPGEIAVHLSLEGFLTSSLPAIVNVGDEIGFYVFRKGAPEAGKGETPKQGAEAEYIGPFRIVSLGKRITRDLPDRSGSSSTDVREITFAVVKDKAGKIDEKIQRLVEARLSRPGEVVVTIQKMKPFNE